MSPKVSCSKLRKKRVTIGVKAGQDLNVYSKRGAVRVKEANSKVNPISSSQFDDLRNYAVGDQNFKIEYHSSNDMGCKAINWAFDLCSKNVKTMYENAKCGWSPKEKMLELTHRNAKFLVAYNSATCEPVAFSHFRFDMDYGCAVVYCYELSVEAHYQGKGLGKCLMNILDLMAYVHNLDKVVLTVFKSNLRALSFYAKCNFSLDETSPVDSEEDSFDYVILSKSTSLR